MCGGIFCNSFTRTLMQTVGAKKPVRTCDKCIDVVYSMTLGVTAFDDKKGNNDADASFMNDHIYDGGGSDNGGG